MSDPNEGGRTEQYVDEIMHGVPERSRYRWCNSNLCACMGCVNMSTRLNRQEWESWVMRNPKNKIDSSGSGTRKEA